jgi:serine/threonine protein kinase
MEKRLRGRYELEFLAQGGMGTAYRARRGERSYFVKEAPTQQADHLRREAATLQRLPLGNFPRFVELFQDQDCTYLVTEFLAGVTLEYEVLSQPWEFPEEEQLRLLAIALCQQLEILHALKPPLLYLDLKPGNVLRTPEGRVYLVDFGIAQSASEGVTLGDFQGSPQTASPEHYTGRPSVRSDLFSLGATIHYVTTRGQLTRSPQEPFACASLVHPALSPEFLKWLTICLDLNAEARFSSVCEARQILLGEKSPPARTAPKRWWPWAR